jgi:opacity protein-like surface antigen
MRRLALLLLLVSPAAAYADADDWRGFYGGLGAGGGNAHSTWVTDATLGTIDEQVDHKARGGLIGLQWGHRWSAGGPMRFGLELAWYGGKMEERGDANLSAFGITDRERVTKVMNPGSIAVQLGMAGGSRALVYLRGGFAWANIELQAINHQVGSVATWEMTGVGWTAGTGFEVATGKHMSVGLEYDHVRLTAPDRTTTNSGGVDVHADDFKTRMNILLLRLNYRY